MNYFKLNCKYTTLICKNTYVKKISSLLSIAHCSCFVFYFLCAGFHTQMSYFYLVKYI